MMEISLIKIKRQGIVDICKVNIAKVDDLDVAMLVIQVWIGRVNVSNVLLDGGFRVHVIFIRLWKKLGRRVP